MTRQGWRPARSRSGPPLAIIGVLLTLVVVLLIAIVLILNGSGGLATATPSPSTVSSQAVVATEGPGPTLEVTPEPTLEVIPEPTLEVTPASGPSLAPGATPKPTLTSFSGPHTASCTAPNGVAPAGYIHITWTASDTTGVRISIDPPDVKTAYSYGYADYPWPAVSSADVPFACNPPNSDATGPYHLYVVTTAHTTGYYQYRYFKVYLKA
jgi:hypothetical protein